MGFGFLQTPRQQGNRGVSGNLAGSAEVRAAAAGGGGRADVQCLGAEGPLEVPAGAGENRLGKSPTWMHLPSTPSWVVFTQKGA